MTFNDITSRISDRTNITSTAGLVRIGQSVNERYKELVSDVGLESSVRTTTTANSVIGSRYVVFTGIIKLLSVYNPALTPPLTLTERTFDYLRNQPALSDPPQEYAIANMGATTVTIFLDSQAATVYALGADVEAIVSTMSGTDVPTFPENFHDTLVWGGMAVEYDKMQNEEMATKFEAKYAKRVADLKFFIAKSAYLDRFQGDSNQNGPNQNLMIE